MRHFLFPIFTGFSLAAFAAPELAGDVVFEQDASSAVTVTYAIKAGESAIVTFDIQTNGPNGYASIDQCFLTNATGDVNKKIAPGAGKKILWNPSATIPGRFRSKDVRAVVTLHPTNSPPDYMVVDFSTATASGADSFRFYPNAGQIPFGVGDRIYKSRYYVMRRIHAAGRPWPMGSTAKETNLVSEVRHYVTLPEDYYIGIYEITQGHMRTGVTAASVNDYCDTSVANADYCPAAGKKSGNGILYHNIRADNNWPTRTDHVFAQSWGYAQYIRNKVGIKFLLDLPTEAQWEYAARAGAYASAFAHGSDSAADLGEYAWYSGNVPEGSSIQEVGTRKPNAWGLYDMFGNVAEWCLDNYRDDYGMGLSSYDSLNFVGPVSDYQQDVKYKVVRGGSYADDEGKLRSAWRTKAARASIADIPTIGYRLAAGVVYPY
jgi:formylglycine-generating enzyme required for sulfatase activity